MHITAPTWTCTEDTFTYVLALGDKQFQTNIQYPSGVLRLIRDQHGNDHLLRLLAHVVAFDIFKLLSQSVTSIDLGPFAPFITPSFQKLWQTFLHHVSGEWRYRNSIPRPSWPAFTLHATLRLPPIEYSGNSVLLFVGGGKDSLLSAQLLEQIGVPFSTLAYSKANYGEPSFQHRLIDDLLDHTAAARRERVVVEDTFFDGGAAVVSDAFEAETPWSLFLALPIAVARGYSELVLGNERSANRGNVWWSAANEEINHQWGKSFEAERLLHLYVKQELVSSCSYWSILKPIRDSLIFQMVSGPAMLKTHSCNQRKPWCGKCPKCAYVLLGYLTYQDTAVSDSLNARAVLNDPANLTWYRQMVGLEAHTPFECIGEIDEARLMLLLLERAGYTGKVFEECRDAFLSAGTTETIHRLLEIDEQDHNIPKRFAPPVLHLFREAASRCERTLQTRLHCTRPSVP